jgi:ABC-type polysaccharide/polyol phosphate transport system ATPase subunit
LELEVATVVLENVNAHFPIYGAHQRSLHKALFRRATGGSIEREGKNNDRVTVKALTDISLTLHDGDRLGLIGHNGAGKSTLLKLMAGIYEPVSGTIKVEGRVTPLFDAMPGLDGEDTGYENIITSGMLIGMTRQQIEAKIPEIEEFCELGEYLTLPVRTYSTGMTMRLGFALVTALDPGVLLMDEGFGTGDLRFAERAEARMKDFIGRSRIMVLASHSNNAIRSMCNKVVWLESGRIRSFGPVEDILKQYAASVRALTRADAPTKVLLEDRPFTGRIKDVGLADRLARATGAARFTYVMSRDAEDKPKWNFRLGDTIRLRFEYEIVEPVDSLVFGLRLYLPTNSYSGQQVVTDIREIITQGALEVGVAGSIDVIVPDVHLMSNHFLIYAFLSNKEGHGGFDIIDENVSLPALAIESENSDPSLQGVIYLDCTIQKNVLPKEMRDRYNHSPGAKELDSPFQ